MYLISKNPLKFNAGVTGQAEAVVIGEILNTSRSGDCDALGANYLYAKETGEEQKELIVKGGFEVAGEELQTLYDAIKADIPATDNEPLRERTKLYLAFRLKMVETFLDLNPGLTPADIEIID